MEIKLGWNNSWSFNALS